MNKIESASPNSTRKVIVVQNLLGLPDCHAEPAPLVRPEDDAGRGQGDGRRPVRAAAGARRLLPGQPDEVRRVADPWFDAIAAFKAKYGGTPVATTEPVADYLLAGHGGRTT